MARPDVLVLYGANTKAVDKANDHLKKGFSSVAKAAAGVFSVAAVAGYVKSVSTAILETNRWADALGVPIEQLSAMGYATKTVGISTEQLADQLKDVSEKIADAFVNKGGEAVEALEHLKLSAKDLNQLNPADQLLAIAGGLENIESRGAKIQVLESLANDATLLLPLLEDDAAALRNLMYEAEEFGQVFDQAMVQKAKEAAAEMRIFDAQMKSLGQTLAVEVMPYATQFLGWVNDAFGSAMDNARSNLNLLTSVVNAFGWALDQQVLTLDEFGNKIQSNLGGANFDLGDQDWLNNILSRGGGGAQSSGAVAVVRSGGGGGRSAGRSGPSEHEREMQRNRDAAERYVESLREQAVALEFGDRALKEMKATMVAMADGVLPETSAEIHRMIGEVWALEDAKEAQLAIDKKLEDQARAGEQAARDLGMTFTSAFEDAILEGKKFGKVLEGLAKDISRVFLRKTISEPLGAAAASLFSGMNLGSMFRATGGPVTAGQPYIVGERGPELMVPGASGAVVPNGGFGGVQVSNNFDFRGADPGSVMQLRAEAGRIVQQSVAATMAAIEQGGAAARVVGRRA